jgi:hypothetical protein
MAVSSDIPDKILVTFLNFLSFVFFLTLIGPVICREFVNSVSCIKILSLEEVQQMGTQGIQFLTSAPARRLGNGCDSYMSSMQEPRSLSTGMAPVGSVEF